MVKERRKHIRIPILAGLIEYYVRGESYKRDEVGDISNDGMFIKTKDILKPNTALTLLIRLPGDLGIIQIEGTVKWVRWALKKNTKDALGMGVEFGMVSEQTRKILDAYIVYMRNKQIIEVSKKIIDEFFGQGPKPPTPRQ